jgi:flagellar motor switch protein FliM
VAANVDPQEAEALLELCEPPGAPAPAVRPRDFARPMRLNAAELEALASKVRRALPGIAGALARALRGRNSLSLVEAVEASAERLFSTLPEPFAVVRFAVGAQPGWLVWELAPALAAVEIALGAGEPASGGERPFSAIERRMLLRMLEPLVAGVCASLGLAAKDASAPRMREELGSWRDGGLRADHRRLLLHLSFEGPGGVSSMRIYLPGIEPARQGPDRAPAAAVPPRLSEVKLDLAARLGTSDVPLAELLALEPGDVIPLAAPADGPLCVYVEGRACARAVLGKKEGRLALKIVEIGAEEEDA